MTLIRLVRLHGGGWTAGQGEFHSGLRIELALMGVTMGLHSSPTIKGECLYVVQIYGHGVTGHWWLLVKCKHEENDNRMKLVVLTTEVFIGYTNQ